MTRDYTVCIRTLGRAGEMYRRELVSLRRQTLQPRDIIVYIAEGYELPAERTVAERYIYVPKGMVAQRALDYKEVATEWILLLDDDMELAPDSVERLFDQLEAEGGDVIGADVFPNSNRGKMSELMMTLTGRMRGRKDDGRWANRLMSTGGFSYLRSHSKAAYRSELNSGNCLLIRKTALLAINFAEELWLDQMPYAMGDDQVMSYKLHLAGFRQLTSFDCGVRHLDAGSTMTDLDRTTTRLYCDARFKRVFYDRFMLRPERSLWRRMAYRLGFNYARLANLAVSALKLDLPLLRAKYRGYRDGARFVRTRSQDHPITGHLRRPK